VTRAARTDRFEADLEEAASYYLANADLETAMRFVDAVDALVTRLVRNPNLGSQHYSDEVNSELRSFALRGFPYVLFFAGRSDQLTFFRLLHGERDIPAHLRER